jgi:chromate transporter
MKQKNFQTTLRIYSKGRETPKYCFWDILRARPAFQAALRGINATVVGLLGAALYDPVWTSAIQSPADFGLALAAFGLLALWKWPPWLVVLLTGACGAALAAL